MSPVTSQAEAMEVVDAPKPVSNDQKFKLPKFVLLMNKDKVKNKQESYEGARADDVSNVIDLAIKAVGNRKAKVIVQV